MQTDMVLEKEQRGRSTSELAGSRKRERHWAWLEYLKPQSPPSVTHFLLQQACLLIVTFSTSLCRPFPFKPPQKVRKPNRQNKVST